MTALSNKKGIGGHTGGAYDIAPEYLIIDSFMNANSNIYPVHFDDAGHRVAIQYIMSVIKGNMPIDKLFHYREYKSGLPGHPEIGMTPGINFSSGRLGHIWSYLNGFAKSNPDKTIIMYSSDGAQQEGNNSEAARFAVSQNINIKLLIDDNNVTITGHTTEYMPGFDIDKTLNGHGLQTNTGNGENIEDLFKRVQKSLNQDGPVALINKRPMAPQITDIEGTCKGHDAIAADSAVKYFENRKNNEAVKLLDSVSKIENNSTYVGSSKDLNTNRKVFGESVCKILSQMDKDKREKNILAIDSDLAGSCGLSSIKEKYPEIYIQSGIMERNNFSAAAGFGSEKGKQGIFATFAAFQEMIISEITMARLNEANLLVHFSHSGVDDMSDNTCHFGWNNYFAANSVLEDKYTKLYYPADANQMDAVIKEIFNNEGIRFVYSTRSSVPYILNEDGKHFYDLENYSFTGDDEIIREGSDGYIVSYGEMIYRCLDAIERLKKEGYNFGLINKPCLNIPDEKMLEKIGNSKQVFVVESQNQLNGLGIRLGSWLLERGFSPKYAYFGCTKNGNCGQAEQITYQNLDPQGIADKIIFKIK
jgi:transketolase